MVGIPGSYPGCMGLALTCVYLALNIFPTDAYYALFGHDHAKNRKSLMKELHAARERVRNLEGELLNTRSEHPNDAHTGKDKPIRLFMEGAFDLMHYGHMNAFRQARSQGTHLIVGVNSSETITACKGPPVMSDDERCAAVEVRGV